MGRLLRYVISRLTGRGVFSDLYPDDKEDQTARSREIARVEQHIGKMRTRREEIGREVDSRVSSLRAMNESNHYGEAIARAYSGREE